MSIIRDTLIGVAGGVIMTGSIAYLVHMGAPLGVALFLGFGIGIASILAIQLYLT